MLLIVVLTDLQTSHWQQEGAVCTISSGHCWISAVLTEGRQCTV